MYRLLVATLLCAFFSASAFAAFPDGLWKSDGYRELLEVQGDALRIYEVTSISCLPSWTATRKAAEPAVVFTAGDEVFRFLPGAAAGEARMHYDGAVSDVVLNQISAKPSQCEQKAEDSPQKNYAIFWQTFAENYAFFDLRHIDWNAVDKQFRPRVTSATTPKELLAIFQAMIEPLQDAHTSISAHGTGHFGGRRPDPNHLTGDAWAQAREIIDHKYVQGGLQSFCQGHVQFGMLRDAIAYLRVDSFNGYARGAYANALRALQDGLDTAFRDAKQFHGLIIDVRRNSGGDDPLGVEIASRLTAEKYLAYSKVTRNNIDGPLHFTAPQETWVTPSARPGFRGKVILLTGPDTISAGETFSMALMERQPHVQRLGANTQGVFSDVLRRALPNGWTFGLPNEVYLTRDGKAFDGPGVPVEIAVPFFSPEDLTAGRDSALDKALALLAG